MNFKKFAILKKEQGLKVKIYANNLMIKKLQKQDGTQSYGCYRRKVNSKAFAIPILTTSAFVIYSSQNRDSKCFRVNFSSITTILQDLSSILFLQIFDR